ncbi:MAG: ATP-dependent helicase, partial [Krumholzibacteria bacterium]|nr:ATP-dependent helicase [Candidatus Krumholzibacteria bacterium]
AAGGAALEAAQAELATVHGAKGREWDRVILFGADQGRFPLGRAVRAGADADPGGGLEDERRLFYVALTRARRELHIVCSARAPSRFLAEAGLGAGGLRGSGRR